jgi:hypothetical protein
VIRLVVLGVVIVTGCALALRFAATEGDIRVASRIQCHSRRFGEAWSHGKADNLGNV